MFKIKLLDRLFNNSDNISSTEVKSKAFTTMYSLRSAKLTQQNYINYCKEGYFNNPFIFACIDKIAKAMKTIDWKLFVNNSDGEKVEVLQHELLDLLNYPNPYHCFDDILETFVAYLILDGNIFIEKVKANNKTKEIYSLRPDLMAIIFEQSDSIRRDKPIKQFEYRSGKMLIYTPDEILHIKNFNPLDSFNNLGKGAPTLASVSASADQNNESRKWNIALLQNSAVPSGVLEVKDDVSIELDDDKVQKIKERFKNQYQNPENAGEPLVVQYMKWVQTSLNSKDLDWAEGMQQSAREICEGLGIPSVLVGDPSAKTFNNYKEAKKALYVDTVLPMAKKILRAFNQFIVKQEYNENLFFELDINSVDILREERMQLWEKVSKATFLTENEKRQELGYGIKDDLNIYRLPANLVDIPEGIDFNFEQTIEGLIEEVDTDV